MSGLKFEEGTCFFNKAAGPGGCVAPCPDVLPANGGIWELWEETPWGSGNYRGMDGEPAGRHLCCIESAARGLEMQWNRRTFKRFNLILSVWMESVVKKIKARREKRPKGK